MVARECSTRLMERPNRLPFSRRECAALENFKKPPANLARETVGWNSLLGGCPVR
jgi:hypothetical protein